MRNRSLATGKTRGDYISREIGYVTAGFQKLPLEKQQLAIKEFQEVSRKRVDWIYSLLGGEALAELNDESSYTLMKSEEYIAPHSARRYSTVSKKRVRSMDDENYGPVVTYYERFEEMMEDLGRAMEEADARVEPAQARIKPGQYFIKFPHGPELPIFGEILDIRKLGYDEEEQEYIDLQYAEPHMRVLKPTRCYSVAFPKGEVGDTHLSDIDAIIDSDLRLLSPEKTWSFSLSSHFLKKYRPGKSPKKKRKPLEVY